MKRTLLLCLLMILPVQLLASEWYEDYDKARGKFKKGDCVEAEKLLMVALQKNPKPDIKARPYGTITIEYIPHYYLAQCALSRGDMKQAAAYLKQAESYGIDKSTQAKDFQALKQKVAVEGRALAAGIAIVVNTANPLTDISSAELKDIFLGTKTQWGNGTPITPVLMAAGSQVNEFFLKKICGIDETAFNSHWEGLTTANKIMPMVIDQNEWLVRYIEKSPGAIGFINSEKSGSLRVLKLNGKGVNDPGYLLTGQ